MKKISFTRSMWEAISGAGLSDRDEVALYRAIMNCAFGDGTAPEPELSKVAKPMYVLIRAMIGEQDEDTCPLAAVQAPCGPADDGEAE